MIENLSNEEILILLTEMKEQGFFTTDGNTKTLLFGRAWQSNEKIKDKRPTNVFKNAIYDIADNVTNNFYDSPRQYKDGHKIMATYRNKNVPFEKSEEWFNVCKTIINAMEEYIVNDSDTPFEGIACKK